MAYGFLKKMAKKNDEVKTYIKENMIFEAYITLLRTAENQDELSEIMDNIEAEAYLKRTKLTEAEYESLCCEYTNNYYQI